MRTPWPANTVFKEERLDVEEKQCSQCGGRLHVCDHRIRRFFTLDGPVRLCCRLARCSDSSCPSRPGTLSPKKELLLALPGWIIAWDVFCFIGHRRFVRHWSVPQICSELLDTYDIRLSDDAVSGYLRRYRAMLAARQQDPLRLASIYRDIPSLLLSIDGLQPEKGHETLYAVRELNAKLIWFAQPLLSSNQHEVRRLFVHAREWSERLGKPVCLWVSDKQDAFVKGIALEFPAVPHRYCQNHFLRDLAKSMLQQDSHQKVTMRKKVRGLRAIEQQALARVPDVGAEHPLGKGDASRRMPKACKSPQPTVASGKKQAGDNQEVLQAAQTGNRDEQVAQAVLGYCAGVRGILNDDQGGPLSPPGLRMAKALVEVRDSLQRVLDLNKPGWGHRQLRRLANYIDRGLAAVKTAQGEIEEQSKEMAKVVETLAESSGTMAERKERYERLQQEYQEKTDETHKEMGKKMRSWSAGLFVAVKQEAEEKLPTDNLELERWFRLPKRHQRRIHGRQHAGVRLVQEGATLLPTLNAHETHKAPFTAEELLPYRHAVEPLAQTQAIERRKVMRKARSKKSAPSSSPNWRHSTPPAFSRLSGG
jgi:hypothetical protein